MWTFHSDLSNCREKSRSNSNPTLDLLLSFLKAWFSYGGKIPGKFYCFLIIPDSTNTWRPENSRICPRCHFIYKLRTDWSKATEKRWLRIDPLRDKINLSLLLSEIITSNPLQKSERCQKNRNAPHSLDLSSATLDCLGYLLYSFKFN